MRRMLLIMMALALVMGLMPVAGVLAQEVEPEVIGSFGFIPNSGEASVSKVDLVNFEEVARYYTADRTVPPPNQWRTSRIAMDAGGNAWVLNVGSDGSGLQGAVVRIQADTEGLTLTHAYTNQVPKEPDPLDFGTDEAVQVFPVGVSQEMPRAIAIDGDGFIWVGFYGSGRLAKFEYDEAGLSLTQVDAWTNSGIGFYEMKLHPDGTLFISSRQSTSTPTRPGIVTGIYTFDPGTGAFALEPVSLPSNGPYSLLIAEDGTVYATAYSNLLYVRDTGGNWTNVTITGSSQNRGMAFDASGNIWIASTTYNGGFGGTVVYQYNPSADTVGPNYDLQHGTVPVGVGKDVDGNMWAVCRSDGMPQGWIEGFNPVTQAKVDAIQVGNRPYAYGDFVQFAPPTGEIGDFVWHDVDRDGIQAPQDPEEEGIAGVEVNLWSANATCDPVDIISTTTTNSTGYYLFDDLPAGNYRVQFVLPAGYNFTTRFAGNDTTVDSNADPVTGITDCITLAAGDSNLTIDAGMYMPTFKICGYKFAQWDEDLIPLYGWEITLQKVTYNATSQLWDADPGFAPQTTTTDAEGKYCFADLEAGNYTVSELLKPGWEQLKPVGNQYIVELPSGATDLDDPDTFYNFVNTPEQWCGDQTAWAAQKHPGETRFSDANNWATYVTYSRGSGNSTVPALYPLYAGQHYLAGILYVYDEGDTLYVQYTTEIPQALIDHCIAGGGKVYQREGYCAGEWTGFFEYHLAVGNTEKDIPRTMQGRGRNGKLTNPIPGRFAYKDKFDSVEPETEWIKVNISKLTQDPFVIAAHAVMQWCGYDCRAVDEIEAALL